MHAQIKGSNRGVIRWGILGCGDVCEVKSGPAFQKATGSELVAVMRRQPGLAEDYARRHDVPRWHSEAEALIHDPAVDAVYIATPPGAHCAYALQVCAAGKPAYVEKPLARSAAEGARMVEAFARAGLPLFTAYYRRALPRFLKVKALLEAGAVGRITAVRVRHDAPAPAPGGPMPWRLEAAHAGGGLFLDVGSHTLDLLDFLLGPLEGVSGAATKVAPTGGVEDVVALTFRTRAGASGAASWSFAAAQSYESVVISGERGQVGFSVFGDAPVRLETAAGPEEFTLPHPPHIQQPLIQAVVDALLGKGACPSTGETAQRTARVMDQALDSYYGGRGDAFWERPHTWPGARARDGANAAHLRSRQG